MAYKVLEAPMSGGDITIATINNSCIVDITVSSMSDANNMIASTATTDNQFYFKINPNTSTTVHTCTATVSYKANGTSCLQDVLIYQNGGYEEPVTPPSLVWASINSYSTGYADADEIYHTSVILEYQGVEYTTATVEVMIRTWRGPDIYSDELRTVKGGQEFNLLIQGPSTAPTTKQGEQILYIKCGGAHFGDQIVHFTDNTQCRS
jgi:hypothetical protein